VPTTRRTRQVGAGREEVWRVVSDPDHLPRWWPRVQRVEDVAPERWTKVLGTAKGKPVRADEQLVESEPLTRRVWTQEIEESPFERMFREVTTEVVLEPEGEGTRVTLALHQRLRGINRLGGFLVRRASGRLLDEALDGLERASGA
jgi:carbon monoxide dehydrogenase subunit G